MVRVQLARPASERRLAFTLIELLIVIAIIVILASMLAGAAMKTIDRAYETKARTEISQMSQAMADFYSRFHAYPPTRLQLGPIAGIDAQSKQFILKCWPRISPSESWAPLTGALSGDQVLVWALGGMQGGGDGAGFGLGFSDDPTNPSRAGGSRIGPFYEFQSNRLFHGSGEGMGFSYMDPFNNQMPYIYFASAPTGNAYSGACGPYGNNQGQTSGPVQPYYDSQSPIHFINPASFQIISAGKNGRFGAGGMWQAMNADSFYPANSDGADDLANFYTTRLGSANN
jgi:prepilin-type N-terminal cleavage/methylation domain-containing protein